MRLEYIIFVLISILIVSCSENSTSIKDDPIIPDYGNFSVNQVDYDSLHIESNNTIKISERSVEKIFLYVADDSEFILQDSLSPNYISNGDYYYLNFQFICNISKEKLYFDYRIQYQMSDNSFTRIDSSHLMLQYPYKSAQVFITANEVYPSMAIYFQDFYIGNQKMFFHPTGPLGLYEYDFNTGNTRTLEDYGSGNTIAHDSSFVFWDNGHYKIERYNILSDSTDLEFDLEQFNFEGIGGLECWQGKLYALFLSSQGNYLAIFDYDGNFLSTISYPEKMYYLTIDNGISYSINYEDKVLSLFDLDSENVIGSKLLPTNEWEGIRIYKGNFYYVEWARRVIGVFPLSDLQ